MSHANKSGPTINSRATPPLGCSPERLPERLPKRLPGRLLRRDRRAVVALEFALIAPLLLVMMLGMIAFGLYFVFAHELQELSSSAARASVAGLSPTERNTLAQQFVTNSMSLSAILNPADLTVLTATSGSPATDYSVTVSYSLKDTPIPMLAQFVSLSFSAITRTSTIQFGGY